MCQFAQDWPRIMSIQSHPSSIMIKSTNMQGYIAENQNLADTVLNVWICMCVREYVCILYLTFNIMALRWFAIAEFLILSSYCSFRFRAISASVNIWDEFYMEQGSQSNNMFVLPNPRSEHKYSHIITLIRWISLTFITTVSESSLTFFIGECVLFSAFTP
jgi:hypothetical protein